MRIYEVKAIHLEKFPDSHFFDLKTLRFFGQTLASFKVLKSAKKGEYWVFAPIRRPGEDGKLVLAGYTERIFNPETGELRNP